MNVETEISKRITIPEYFRRYIDNRVDLDKTNKICCPFHKEDTPSFSYSPDKGVWRCFGACHFGGDVIALHQANNKLNTRQESVESLCNLFHIDAVVQDFSEPVYSISKSGIKIRTLSNQAEKLLDSIEKTVELDYIMTKSQQAEDTISELKEFIQKCKDGSLC